MAAPLRLGRFCSHWTAACGLFLGCENSCRRRRKVNNQGNIQRDTCFIILALTPFFFSSGQGFWRPALFLLFVVFFFLFIQPVGESCFSQISPKIVCFSPLPHLYSVFFFPPWQHVYFISLHTSGLSPIICQSLQRSASVDRDVQPSGRRTRGGNDVSKGTFCTGGVFQPVLWCLMMLWFISITYSTSHCPFHKDPSAEFTKRQINCS